MIKFLALAAALGVTGLSTSAMAQTAATGTVNITATVNATCTIGGLAAATQPDLDFSSAGNASLIDTSTKSRTFGSVDCNTPTHISLTSGSGAAVTTTGAASGGGYANFFNYQAVATYGVATNTLTTTNSGASQSTASASGTPTTGPSTGSLVVAVTPTAGSKLAAGSYLDVLTVTLTAN